MRNKAGSRGLNTVVLGAPALCAEIWFKDIVFTSPLGLLSLSYNCCYLNFAYETKRLKFNYPGGNNTVYFLIVHLKFHWFLSGFCF